MKFCKFTLSLALLTAFCLPMAAQTQGVRANIPFDFVVGAKTLPAGEYSVKPVFHSDSITWVVDGDERGSAVFTTYAVESAKQAHNPSLIFLQGDGRYFLLQVWGGGHMGRELTHPSTTKILVAQDKLVEVAAE